MPPYVVTSQIPKNNFLNYWIRQSGNFNAGTVFKNALYIGGSSCIKLNTDLLIDFETTTFGTSIGTLFSNTGRIFLTNGGTYRYSDSGNVGSFITVATGIGGAPTAGAANDKGEVALVAQTASLNYAHSSDNGLTWAAQTISPTPGPSQRQGLGYIPETGMWYLLTSSGVKSSTSVTTLAAAANNAVPGTGTPECIGYINGLYFLGKSNFGLIYTSPDLIQWTQILSPYGSIASVAIRKFSKFNG